MSPARPPEGARTAARERAGSSIHSVRPPEEARTAAREGADASVGVLAGGARFDQAAGLRRLMGRREPRLVRLVEPNGTEARIAMNLAAALAGLGRATLVLRPADGSVRYVDHRGAERLAVPAAFAASDLTALQAAVSVAFDLGLVDGPGGEIDVPASVAAGDAIAVVRGDSETGAALVDGYGIVKQLHTTHAKARLHVLVAGGTPAVAGTLFTRLASVASTHLGCTLGWLGHLPAAADGGAAIERHNALAALARRIDAWD